MRKRRRFYKTERRFKMKKGRSSRIYKKSFKKVSYNLARGKKKRKEKRAKKLNKRYQNYSYVTLIY